MPEQTIKHENALPGFLLILVPFAFLAVFLSVAWPFMMGATLLFTGNSVWQSYQMAKLSQQVNPFFNQLIVENQGEINSTELSTRASISSNLANRYLHSKAVKFGGTSYRADNQSIVYNFLTVGSLENAFTSSNPNPTATQKLAELEESPTISLFQTLPTAVIETPAVPVPETVAEKSPEPSPPETAVEVAATEPPVVFETPSELPVTETAPVDLETTPPQVIESAPGNAPLTEVNQTPAVPPEIAATEVVAVEPASSFTQALRNIFNAESATVAEEVETPMPDPVSEVALEVISQVDLAKRLDVHASTIYKRRTDVSFAEWTRSRDPEGIAWGYARDTKEFYRIG